MIKRISLNEIRIDEAIKRRPVDKGIVSRYMDSIEEDSIFPPVEVVFDGKNYWLWDGHFRIQAYRELGKKTIRANITQGSFKDAIWLSFSEPSWHSFPRPKSTATKILFEKIFPDPVWSLECDHTIANLIGLSRSYISRCRRKYEAQLERESKDE